MQDSTRDIVLCQFIDRRGCSVLIHLDIAEELNLTIHCQVLSCNLPVAQDPNVVHRISPSSRACISPTVQRQHMWLSLFNSTSFKLFFEFVQIERSIQYANYGTWKNDIISIDLHRKREQNGGGMYPGSCVTFNYWIPWSFTWKGLFHTRPDPLGRKSQWNIDTT